MKRCLAVLVGVSCLASPSFADPTADRRGSSLDVTLDQTPYAGWDLTDAQGHFCAKGDVSADTRRISLGKVAPDVDLVMTFKDAAGHPVRTLNIAGVRHLSSLEKPAHDAVIYQVPVRTYFATDMGKGATGKLASFSDTALGEIHDLGADYVWLTGMLRAASPDDTDVDVVKGDAGSFFAVNDAWDVNPQLGTLADFSALVERAHRHGLRVMMDLVVNHTARAHHTGVLCKAELDFGAGDDRTKFFSPSNDYFYIQGTTFVPPPQPGKPGADGLYNTDIFTPGIHLESPARVTGNNLALAKPRIDDWFETAKLNYGYNFATKQTAYAPRPRSWDQMVDVARFWLGQGVDGFRIDMAHAVPVEFWRYFVAELRKTQPNVFLLAEAYEGDGAMKAPDFTYDALFQAGIDTVFNSELYHRLLDQGQQPGRMYGVRLAETPALRPGIVHGGYVFTNFLENHDEVRVASPFFAAHVPDQASRAELGLALSTFAALMPTHFLIQGGQEVQEDASVIGGFAGDNGRTSIFDFVYQSETRKWLDGDRPTPLVAFRGRYQKMLALKHQVPFALAHTAARPSFVDLHEANWTSQQSYWIASYLRYDDSGAYLVVSNGDPFTGHEAVIHMTYTLDQDPLGALAAAHVTNDGTLYRITEVLNQPGLVPKDPGLPTAAVPGWALYRPSTVPSGFYLGVIPASTTYVFKIEPAN